MFSNVDGLRDSILLGLGREVIHKQGTALCARCQMATDDVAHQERGQMPFGFVRIGSADSMDSPTRE